MLFTSAHELFGYLNKELDRIARNAKKVTIDIATYGLSLFDEKHDYGEGYIFYEESAAHTFIKNISKYGFDTRLLVGIQDIRKFKNGSFGLSTAQYSGKISEVLMVGERYGIKALPTNNSHLKMYRINNLYVVGGINLTNSYWADSAVVLEDQQDKNQIQNVFNDMWRGATSTHPLTPACMLVGDSYDYGD